MPARFKITDELYWFEADAQGTPIQVLATAQSAAKNKAFPQVFVVQHPKARVVGITLGHDGQAHSPRGLPGAAEERGVLGGGQVGLAWPRPGCRGESDAPGDVTERRPGSFQGRATAR